MLVLSTLRPIAPFRTQRSSRPWFLLYNEKAWGFKVLGSMGRLLWGVESFRRYAAAVQDADSQAGIHPLEESRKVVRKLKSGEAPGMCGIIPKCKAGVSSTYSGCTLSLCSNWYTGIIPTDVERERCRQLGIALSVHLIRNKCNWLLTWIEFLRRLRNSIRLVFIVIL